jgi:hypothetical protein
MGELLFGLAALCPLLRRFEREVRTKDVFHLSIYCLFELLLLSMMYYYIIIF